MALISCPECGKQVSDRAPACPNCGCPICAAPVAAAPQVDRSQEIAKYLDLAIKGIQGQNAQQVEQYCQAALEIDPYNYRAWELEARGILFGSTLAKNKVYQAISAAANAVEYIPDRKEELAESLYNSIYGHITGLLNIALINMPTMYAPQYVAQCMGYYGELLAGIPYLPRQRIDAEMYKFIAMEEESKKAIMPRKRMIYASHALKPAWHEQYWTMLQQRGRV